MLPEAPQLWWKWGVQTFSQRTTLGCTGEYRAAGQWGHQVWELGLRHHHSLSPAHHSWARIKWKCGGEGQGVGLEDNAVVFLIYLEMVLYSTSFAWVCYWQRIFFFLWSNQIKSESFSLLLAALHPLTAFFSGLKTILLSNSLSSVPAHLIFLRFDKGLFVRLWN